MTAPLTDRESQVFHGQMTDLADFVAVAGQIIERVVTLEESQVVPKIVRLLK